MHDLGACRQGQFRRLVLTVAIQHHDPGGRAEGRQAPRQVDLLVLRRHEHGNRKR